jgi:hypothetical protein
MLDDAWWGSKVPHHVDALNSIRLGHKESGSQMNNERLNITQWI